MICIYHNKDLDGYSSGAIVRRAYPNCTLIGWDYGNPIPWDKIGSGEDIIMIDISFPMKDMNMVRAKNKSLLWIDHHISAKKEYDSLLNSTDGSYQFLDDITYIYEPGIAACEIGWKYFFPDEKMPTAITLLGRYDTWRKDEGDWEKETLPFQYYMRLVCSNPETFPNVAFQDWRYSVPFVNLALESGSLILDYQREQDKKIMRSSFVIDFEGLRALVVNVGGASSNTFLSVWDEEKHDVMMPFFFNGNVWNFSIYTTKEDIDCSVIAKKLGGGGHKQAAGFIMQELPVNFKR